MTKNKNVSLIVVILIGIISFFVYSQAAIAPQTETKQKTTATEVSNNVENKIENYLVYTPELFNLHASKRRVLFFYASWCTTCVPANANFLKESNLIPKDVVVFRINYNDPDTDETEKQLAKKYQITYQHTFVQVDKDGKVVTKWNGGESSELLSKIK